MSHFCTEKYVRDFPDILFSCFQTSKKIFKVSFSFMIERDSTDQKDRNRHLKSGSLHASVLFPQLFSQSRSQLPIVFQADWGNELVWLQSHRLEFHHLHHWQGHNSEKILTCPTPSECGLLGNHCSVTPKSLPSILLLEFWAKHPETQTHTLHDC